ncbi:MAG: hypothetical protein BWY52_03307 [Chloroflexi bacterium ADurb.Bin325]|nr:MAG: hypothetical protein BWY52_03307 [Chloroflexi bacterium ADurb.Bin325]
MDWHSLAASHLSQPRPDRQGPDAERAYWLAADRSPAPDFRRLLSRATVLGGVMLLIGVALF